MKEELKETSKYEIVVDKESHRLRLDLFLKKRMKWYSRSKIQQLIKEGLFLKDESLLKCSKKVFYGEKITIIVPKTSCPPSIDKIELPILYEDNYFVAIDKPPNLSAHPTSKHPFENVIFIMRRLYKLENGNRLDLAHRIDRETSGVLLLVKKEELTPIIKKAFAESKVIKEYLAIVKGEIKEENIIIDRPLGNALKSNVAIKKWIDYNNGTKALTEIKVLKRFSGYTLVKAFPKTGKQHQIRVHLSSIGFPIVGDKIYGPDENIFLRYLEGKISENDIALLEMPRQALHAYNLKFKHPVTSKEVSIISPMPDDMENFLNKIFPS